jgi:hypothetical protein
VAQNHPSGGWSSSSDRSILTPGQARGDRMGLIKWLGRVTLWVVFLPLGLWRSIRHGKNKRQAEVLRAIQAQAAVNHPTNATVQELEAAKLDAERVQGLTGSTPSEA